MTSRNFRVDHDDQGNVEVSPKKPRKLRPLEDEDGGTPQSSPRKPKSALKGGASKPNPQEASDAGYVAAKGGPDSGAAEPPSAQPVAKPPAVKSALKGGKSKPPASDGEELVPAPPTVAKGASNAPAKPALKGALKRSAPDAPPPGELPPNQPTPPASRPPPKPAVRSALKTKEAAPAVPASPAVPATNATNPDSPKARNESKESVASTHKDSDGDVTPPRFSLGAGTDKRVSNFRMKIGDELSMFSKGNLMRHFYHFASQKLMWQDNTKQQEALMPGRKSIKLEELGNLMNFRAQLSKEKSFDGSAAQNNRKSSNLRRSQLLIIEEENKEPEQVELNDVPEISPLKDILLEKKIDAEKLRKLLTTLPDRAKWIDASLDATPPPMPSPLFQSVAGGFDKVVKVLIEFDCDVNAVYTGKSMLKGWIKPNTPLLDSVRSRKGRFVGTMLGDKLQAIEELIMKAQLTQRAAAEGLDDDIEELEEEPAPPPPIYQTSKAGGRERRKSVHLPTTKGQKTMEHTHGHPDLKYELLDKFCDQSLLSVREARNVETGESFSVKAGNKIYERCGKDPEAELWNEISIMRKLDHPNIIRLFETFEDETHIFMVFEVAHGGDLLDRLLQEGCLQERTAMRLAHQMGSAIQHLHSLCICHRQIQPESFFVVNQGSLDTNTVKVMDFTAAKEFGTNPLTTKVCTLHYVSPEILTSDTGYTERIDIWSFGVVVYVMIAGTLPFCGDSDISTLQAVKSGDYSFVPDAIWMKTSKDVKNLIKDMLVVDPAKRLTAEEMMNHASMGKAKAANSGTKTENEKAVARSEATKAADRSTSMRNLFMLLAEKITNEQLEDLRLLFKSIDVDKTGVVDFGACNEKIKEMTVGHDDVQEVLGKVHGNVNYNMYLATMTDWRRHIRREAARAIFGSFDIDKNGLVSLYELAQAMLKPLEELGFDKQKNSNSVTGDEVGKIWDEMKLVFGGVDLEDKELTFEEFFQQLPRSNEDISF